MFAVYRQIERKRIYETWIVIWHNSMIYSGNVYSLHIVCKFSLSDVIKCPVIIDNILSFFKYNLLFILTNEIQYLKALY